MDISGDNCSLTVSDARQVRDVWLAIGSLIRHRLTDDPGALLLLPQHLPAIGVHRFEPAFHGAVENNSAGGSDRAAPDREFFIDRPARFLGDRVPCRELAAVVA